MPQTLMGAYTSAKVHAAGTYFEKCKLRTYDAGCPKPLTPHHCIPDHCWKADGKKKSRISLAGAKTKTMGHGSGLCICVDGADKSSDNSAGKLYRKLKKKHKNHLASLKKGGDTRAASEKLAERFRRGARAHKSVTATKKCNLGKHGKIHHIFDAGEDSLAKRNRKKFGDNIATLGQLEGLAARTIQAVTGCDEKSIKEQMREYHAGRGIKRGTLLRANSTGKHCAEPARGQTLGSPFKK